jgi:hypothetical protein
MSWILVEREMFVRMCDDCEISDLVREQIKLWAPTFQNTYQLSRQKKVFWTTNNRFEIWVVRLPNPEANKGKRGGFRLVLFLDLNERTINLEYIEERDEMGFKDEGVKKKNKYSAFIEDLKEFLTKKDVPSKNSG